MTERYVVGMTALATPVEVEAKALAADLGTTIYEERLKLTAGVPLLALSTTDEAAARALLGKLRARGHRAQLCRASEVVAASAMTVLKHFTFDTDGLDSGGDQLPWDDVSALIQARHPIHAEKTATIKERKFDLGRTVMTGGLLTSKTSKREVVTKTDDVEHVLYLFRQSGEAPWLLREHGTNYSCLGARLDPSAARNFTTTIERFRAHAPHARFDDSLARRPIKEPDLFAHLIARS
ncbi:MAG: hypothetical protein ABI678_18370 [Kofleriaceae bacterium]